MNRIALFAIAGVFSIVACSDENAPIVWNVAESSSSVTVAESSSGAESPSSSSENIAESSSSASAPSSSTVADTVWHQANLTWYTSWPEPDSEECIEYNGCTWAGYFAGVEETFRMELIESTCEDCNEELSKELAQKTVEGVRGGIAREIKFHLDTRTDKELVWSYTYPDGHTDTWVFYRNEFCIR